MKIHIRPRPSYSSSAFVDPDRGRRTRPRTIAAILFFAFICTAAAQEPQVRTTLNPQNDVWVGQRITLVVELLAPGVFSSASAFDLPDPKGLLLVPPSGSPVVSAEEINGTVYAVQRHEVSVFAQRPGEWTIPSFTVRFSFKDHPMDSKSVSATVRTEPIHFAAKLPPGAEKLGTVLSARDLTAVESWNPEPGKAKAGDAFTRTITFSAPDIPAMAFPPFPTSPIDGLGIYPKPPEVLDHSERGELRGERRDVITYVCQRPGHFVIPAARLTWFDLDAKQLRTIDFPANSLDVAANPAMQAALTAPSSAQRSTLKWTVTGLVILVLLAAVLWKRRIRCILLRWLAPFRPIHLQPLNPIPLEHTKTMKRNLVGIA